LPPRRLRKELSITGVYTYERESVSRSTPGKFYKGRSQKKHLSFGWSFSCFSTHLIERDLFGPTAPCARLRAMCPRGLGFHYQRFSSLLRDEA
jgi:hypothetical protein